MSRGFLARAAQGRAKSAQTDAVARSSGLTQMRAGRPYKPDWSIQRAVENGWQRSVWVYRCVHAIATAQCKLPVVARRMQPGMPPDPFEGTPIPNHPVANLLNSRPSPNELSYSFRYRKHATDLLSPRGSYQEVVRNGLGDVLQLTLLPPHLTSPIPDPTTFVSGYEVQISPGSAGKVTVAPQNVIWQRRPHPIDPYSSMTPLEAAGLAVETDWEARLYQRNFLKNDGMPAGIIKVSGQMTDDDARDIKSQVTGGGGPRNANHLAVVSADEIDLVKLSENMRDLDFISGRTAMADEILAAYGLDRAVATGSTGNRCVDDETEALTQRGWVRGDEITTDDVILSMDPADKTLKWSPVHEVYRAPYDGPMYRIKNKSADFLVTPGHNWAILPRRAPDTADAVLRKVEDLIPDDRILAMGAPEASVTEPVYTDAFVELVGWAVTEGCYDSPGYVRICQNEGPFAQRIRRVLKEAGAVWKEGEQKDRPIMRRFYLRGEIARAVTAVSPGKVMTMEFLTELTASQRELLLQTMIDADGARQRGTVSWIFTQKNPAAAEAFVTLAALAGYTTSMRHEPNGNGQMRYRVIVRRGKVFSIQHGARTVEDFSGMVWCPRTDYGTFVARRHGRVVVTGNTYDNLDGAFVQFWMGVMLDELTLISQGWSALDPDPDVVIGFDVTRVGPLQRARRDVARFFLGEVTAGVRTADEYRPISPEPMSPMNSDTSNQLRSDQQAAAAQLLAENAPGDQTESDAANPQSGTTTEPKGRTKALTPAGQVGTAEQAITAMMSGLYVRQAGVLAARLKGPKVRRGTWLYQPPGSKAVDVDELWQDEVWDTQLRADADTVLTRTFDDLGSTVAAAAGGAFLPPEKQVLQPLLDRIVATNRTTKAAVAAAVREQPGDTLDTVLDRLAEVFDQAAETRAATIGVTESTAAAGLAALTAAGQVGAPAVEWQADAGSRDSHAQLDGQQAEPGEPFVVGTSNLRYPGDPDGDAGDVVNCHCTLALVVDRG